MPDSVFNNPAKSSSRSRVPFESRPDLPIALVVGAGGMSMAIASRLGQSHRVIITSLGEDELKQAGKLLHDLGIVYSVIRCDITVANSVDNLGRQVAAFGKVQTLAHVAALSSANAGWRAILEVNLCGAVSIEQQIQPLMARSGAAVFISSGGGHRRKPEQTVVDLLDNPLQTRFLDQLSAAMSRDPSPYEAYSLSKWALNRMVKHRAPEWGRSGVRILSISPGLIDTEMGAVAYGDDVGVAKSAMRDKIPLTREGSMVEIADAVEFFTSPRASYITGTDLLVDGGLSAALAFPLKNE